MWDDLMRATCAPRRWQFTVIQLAQAQPATVRIVGLLCMIIGALALFALHR